MTDPRVLITLSVIFALMGTYSLYVSSRHIRRARLAGQRLRWYKQTGFLAGLEYILLTFVLLLTLVNHQSFAPQGFTGPLYLLLVLSAAIVAALVIRQGLADMRAARGRQPQTMPATQVSPPTLESAAQMQTREDSQAQARRQRERRKNAATTRRRRAGKA